MGRTSSSTPRIVSMLAALLTASVVGGFLLSGLALPAVGVAGITTRAGVSLFESLPSEMEVNPLAQQSVILAKDGTVLATPYAQNRIIVPIDQISPNMQNAQVAIEDERFYEHSGIDMRGTARAFFLNATSDAGQGGSTLTQQYVKQQMLEGARRRGDSDELLRLSSRSGTTGYVRKIRELKYAVALEKRYSKQEILQGYLNMVYYGDRTYGVEAAAMHYFSVHAKDLSVEQAALLAGLVQAPSQSDPVRNPDRAKKRRNVVLGKMLKLKMITQEQHDKAVKSEIKLKLLDRQSGTCDSSPHAYFCWYVMAWLKQQPVLGKDPEARLAAVQKDGLTIQTSFDPKKAKEMDKILRARVPVADPSNVKAAAITVEPGTGYVVAMSQTTDYSNTKSPGKTGINYNTDWIYGGSSGFQYGSTQKFYSIIEALKQGWDVNATVDVPKATMQTPVDADNKPVPGKEDIYAVKFQDELNKDKCNTKGAPWQVVNHNNDDYSGKHTLGDISASSINTAFVQLNSELGFCKVWETMKAMGVHQANMQGGPMDSTPAAITLGTGNVSPMTLASSFATMAGGGQLCTPSPVVSITDARKRPVKVPSVQERCKQAIPPDVALNATKVFSQVVDHYNAGISDGRPSAGKSGTSDGGTSTWFAGVTSQLSTAVWVGLESPRQGDKVYKAKIGDKQLKDYMFSTDFAVPLWTDIMEKFSEGTPIEQFKLKLDPGTKVGETKEVPDVRGKSMADASNALRDAGFYVSNGSKTYTSDYPANTVGSQDPAPGSQAKTGDTITLSMVADEQVQEVQPQNRNTPQWTPSSTYYTPRPSTTRWTPRPTTTATTTVATPRPPSPTPPPATTTSATMTPPPPASPTRPTPNKP